MPNATGLKTATVLAFERKLDPSDALFFSGRWDARDEVDWAAISVREKSVRGTISNRLKSKDQDAAKLDAKIENPNLQTVDVATLPPGADTLKVSFTVRVLAGTGTPSACNNADYQAKLRNVMEGYTRSHGFGELARRYTLNLANGRFLWRNRLGAEQIDVVIDHIVHGNSENNWKFDALSLPLRNFDAPADAASELSNIANLIAEGLGGKKYLLLRVTAFVRIGSGQEVFPSQELILDRDSSKKSKTLYNVASIAGIHSQKIGNALRTIDTWHTDPEVGPIAVEPYGSVTALGKAFRPPASKLDFYSLLDSWVLHDKMPTIDQQHFVVATLLRGGVFGDSGKD